MEKDFTSDSTEAWKAEHREKEKAGGGYNLSWRKRKKTLSSRVRNRHQYHGQRRRKTQ